MDSVNRIFELIKENRTSAKEVARSTGLSPSNFSEWKKGNNKPGLGAITKIAAHFNVSTDYLQGLSDNRTAPRLSPYTDIPKKYRRLIERYESLTESDDENRKRIRDTIDLLLGLDEHEDE